MKNKLEDYIVMTLFLLLFAVVVMPLASAVWYNPFTWNDNTYSRNDGWYVDYLHGIEKENFDISIDNLDNGKAKICLLPKTDLKINDDIVKQSKATLRKDGVKTGEIEPSDMETESEGGLLTKICIDVDKQTEDWVKFGEQSAVVSYSQESVLINDSDGNELLEVYLSTDNFYYKNDKPHIDKGLGYQNTHTFSLNAKQDADEVLNNIEMIEMNTGELTTKEYDLKIQYLENEERATYDTNCTTVYNETTGNETEECETYQNGTEIVSVKKWMDAKYLNYSINMTAGEDLTVGVFMDLKQDEYIDIVPTVAGIEFDFWASVSGDLSTDLISYYKLNGTDATEGTDVVTDIHGTNDGTNNGATRGVTGKIDNAFDFDGTNDYVSIPDDDSLDKNIDYITINAWVYASDYSTSQGHVLSKGYDGVNVPYIFGRFADEVGIFGFYDGDWRTIPVYRNFSTNEWVMMTMTYDGTTLIGYENGVEIGSLEYTGTIPDSTSLLRIGAHEQNGDLRHYFSGKIDELGIWSRALTSTEISDYLYDSGDGIPYEETDLAPTVVLDSPANETAYNTNSQSVDFKCKGQDDSQLDNLTFFLWNMTSQEQIYNETETTVTNDTLETFTQTVYGGTNYSWNCLAYDNSSQSAYADNNRTVFVYAVPDQSPNIEIGNGSPEDNAKYITSPKLLTFNASNIYDDQKVDNASLVIDGTITNTTIDPVNDSNVQWNNTFTDGDYDWYFIVYDNASQSVSTTTRSFGIDSIDPEVNITAPANGTVVTEYNQSLDLNWTATDLNLDSCWYYKDMTEIAKSFFEEKQSPARDAKYYNIYENTFSEGTGDIQVSYWFTIPEYRVTNFDSATALRVSELKDTPTCDNATYDDNKIIVTGNIGKYFCVENNLSHMFSFEIIDDDAPVFNVTSEYTKATCTDNTTRINYPTTNPDETTYYFFANDTFGQYSTDETTLVKSQDAPNINLTAPQETFGTLIGGQTLDLNWSITNVTALDECWYSYNGTNTTVTCGDEHTTFNYAFNVNELTFYANDTLGNVNSTFKDWEYVFIEDSVTYDNSVYETTEQDYELSFTLQNSFLDVSSDLYYAGEAYDTDVSCSGLTCTSNVAIDTPLVTSSASDNNSFFWEINVYDGDSVDSYNSTTNYQTANEINLTECGTYTNQTLNFTAYSEKNKTRLYNFSFYATFEYWLGGGTVKKELTTNNNSLNGYQLCISPDNQTYHVDADIRYTKNDSVGYVSRNYYLSDHSIDSESEDVPLYLLSSEDSTTFIIEVLDQTSSGVENALVYIQRCYEEDGTCKTVQVAKTDENGKTVGFYKVETIDYRHIITKNGQTLLTQSKAKVFPESQPYTLIFRVGESPDYPWESIEDNPAISISLAYNTTSNITTYSWIDDTGASPTGRLLLYQIFANKSEELICNSSSTFDAGSLTCDLANYSDGYFKAEGYLDGKLVKTIQIYISDALDMFGDFGILVGWFIILTVTLVFIWNPTVMIIAHNIAVIGVNLIGLVTFSPIYIFSMIAISILVIIFMKT